MRHAQAVTDQGLVGRWRRLDDAIERLRAADAQSSPTGVADALVETLDKLYPLWEAWQKSRGLDNPAQNREVSGDVGGETTAALILARTETTYDLVEPGRSSNYGEGIYGEGLYGIGVWRFRPLSDRSHRSREGEAGGVVRGALRRPTRCPRGCNGARLGCRPAGAAVSTHTGARFI